LTWVTDWGEETVHAIKKPLGLIFEKQTPIMITREKDGHGKDVGIQVGWILKKINNVDITKMDFEEADALLHAEVDKLPGGIHIPLRWDTGDGDVTVWAFKKPLAVTYQGRLPIKITKETEGHGKDIGIEVGWVLKSVNNIDITKETSFAVVDAIFHGEIDKLPKRSSFCERNFEWPTLE